MPALQRRVGGADASAEERPGAALARADVGSRSAAREHPRRVRRRDRESRCQALQRPRGARTARPRRCRPSSARPQGSPQRAISEAEAMPRRRAGPARSEAERFMSAGASPMAIGLGARHGACQREVRGGAPGTRRVERPSPSSPRAPEPSVGASVPRRPQAPCRLRSGRAPRGRVRHDLAEREEREHDQGDDAEDEHERAPPSAPGGGAVELPLFTGRAGGGPGPPSLSRPVKPRRVASLRPRAAFGPRRTAVARRPSTRLGLTRIRYDPRAVRREGAPAPPSGAARGPAAQRSWCGPEGVVRRRRPVHGNGPSRRPRPGHAGREHRSGRRARHSGARRRRGL